MNIAHFPLSYSQRGILFFEKLFPSTSAFNIPLVFSFEELIDKEALIYSLRFLCEKHEALRSVISIEDNQPVISFINEIKDIVSELYIEAIAFEDPSVQRLIMQEISRPFNLETGPLFSCKLIKLSSQKHILCIVIHHIICDGWSIGIMHKDIENFYSQFINKAANNKLLDAYKQTYQLSQYLIDENNSIKEKNLEDHLKYWNNILHDFPPPLNLPYIAGHSIADKQKYINTKGALVGDKMLPHSIKNDFTNFCIKTKSTPFSVLLSIFMILLYRYTSQNDIVVGVPFSNRHSEETENLIGFMINTLPIRISLSNEMSFNDVLNMVNHSFIEAQRHKAVPFEYVLERLKISKSKPFFQILFLQDSSPNQSLTLSSLKGTFIPTYSQTAKTELSVSINLSSSKIFIEYACDLFKQEMADQIHGDYVCLIEKIINNPYEIIKKLKLNNSNKNLSRGLAVMRALPHENAYNMVFDAVKKFPHKQAVAYLGKFFTYADLDKAVNQRAFLFSKYGVRSGHKVAVILNRSIEALVNLLAIFKIRAIYVPIDPLMPERRLTFILEDAEINFAIAARPLNVLRGADQQVVFLYEEELLNADYKEPIIANEEIIYQKNDLAYVLYTSGSTGYPKGVSVAHDSLMNCILATQRFCNINSLNTFIAVTSLTFDVSLLDYFLPLTMGGKVVIMPQGYEKLESAAWNVLKEEKTIAIQGTPSFWQLFLDKKICSTNRLLIMAAGEELKKPLVKKLFTVGEIYNLYGPTEGTIYASAQHIKDEDLITIGEPLENIDIYIVDTEMNCVPIGVPGELYIGGAGLARGYVNRPELTAERFIDNPFASIEDRDLGRNLKLYRTGDLGRYLPDGNIEFLGRIDDQVKIRGYRIELGEIEAALLRLAVVKKALVLAVEQNTGKDLLAYVIVDENCNSETIGQELRIALEGVLPEYMLPKAFIFLKDFPLSTNGKVDRNALPKPDRNDLTAIPFVEPQTEIENILAGIWKRLLHVKQVGRYDNFFQIGGHSLLVIQMMNEVQRDFSCSLSLREFFNQPTLYALGVIIQGVQEVTTFKPIPKHPLSLPIPLSFTQQRIWFLQKLLTQQALYHIPFSISLHGKVVVDALSNSLQQIINRHSILRTNIIEQHGEPSQVIRPILEYFKVKEVDLTGVVAELQTERVEEILQSNNQQPFDLEEDLLIRVLLLRLNAEHSVLAVTLHHIVADGWSLAIFFRELSILYNNLVTGSLEELKPLVIQFSDFAHWQRSSPVPDLGYWTERLESSPILSTFPTNYVRPAELSYQGCTVEFSLSATLIEKLKTFSQEQNATLFMTMLAAFMMLLHRYSQQEDLIVGLPVANRSHPDVEPLIGFFTNTLAFRLRDLNDAKSFLEILHLTKEMLINDFEHQDAPFEQIVDHLQVPRMLNANPLFQVMFSYQSLHDNGIELSAIAAQPWRSSHTTAKFDMNFFIQQQPNNTQMLVEYSIDLYDEEIVQRLCVHYQQLLNEILLTPDLAIGEFEILTRDERQKVLCEWNNTSATYPTEACLHQLFEEQVTRTPGAIAVRFGEQELTYEELNSQANKLAYALQAEGVVAESLVAIAVERSLEMVICVLAILKAGGAYVPLDPTFPSERLKFMLEDTNAAIVLAFDKSILDGIYQGKIIDPRKIIIQDSLRTSNLCSDVKPNNLAYVIYTSGSTGRPKGVMIEHKNIINFIVNIFPESSKQIYQTVACLTNLSFDIAALEIFWPLLNGRQIILYSSVLNEKDSTIKGINADLIQVTPSLAKFLLLSGWKPSPSTTIICGGEELHEDLAYDIIDSAKQLINLYGPTETTVWASKARVIKNKKVSLGNPVANYKIYILNKCLKPQPIGVIGEIYIGGAGLARGYLNQNDLTKERFINNPFMTSNQNIGIGYNSKLYKTGDFARYLPDGSIEFLGRADDQIKIRGYRVELEEIRQIINQVNGIKDSHVVYTSDETGEKNVIVFYIPNESLSELESQTLLSNLKFTLKANLPFYMVPTSLNEIQQTPMLPSGKIDKRRLLGNIIEKKANISAEIPANFVEYQLLNIWQHHLQMVAINVQDNYFDIGGTSLMSVSLLSLINEKLGVQIPFSLFYKNPQIRSIAEFMLSDAKNLLPTVNISSGSHLTLFLIHPASGLCTEYFHLADVLSDIKIIGINNPYLGIAGKRFLSIFDMAKEYKNIIKTIQPEGPYFLGGWSFGGNVAFEIARQLTCEGNNIEKLFLFDSIYTHPYGIETNESDIYLSPEIQYNINEKEANQLFNSEILENLRLLSDFESSPYSGPLNLFKGTQDDITKDYPMLAKANGWDLLCKNDIEIFPIPVKHANFFDKDKILIVSSILREALKLK